MCLRVDSGQLFPDEFGHGLQPTTREYVAGNVVLYHRIGARLDDVEVLICRSTGIARYSRGKSSIRVRILVDLRSNAWAKAKTELHKWAEAVPATTVA